MCVCPEQRQLPCPCPPGRLLVGPPATLAQVQPRSQSDPASTEPLETTSLRSVPVSFVPDIPLTQSPLPDPARSAPSTTIPAPGTEPSQDISQSFPVSTWDVLILITYFVCIITALSKIKNSFNDEYTVTPDEKTLKQSLAEQKLENMVGISFGFDKRYEFGKNDKLRQFGINITNKSSTHSIYVDWDYCTMTDLGGRARRVTRLMPGTTLDLFQTQAFSAIAPGTTLKETITAEDVLKRKESKDDKVLVALGMEVDKPLLNFGGVDKKKQARFVATLQTMEFFLDVAIRLVGPARSSSDHALIRCKFILQKLPWQAGLPWNPK
ncbi:hypothetical protein OsccyDRAFT_3885 [Leptolyngbyaceae cyanobacterium JSC-12]|nr:hypothetical protein OsccyDRAFT_3885 [Leptolyngbyaceae cyanobacterium JSC-12]